MNQPRYVYTREEVTSELRRYLDSLDSHDINAGGGLQYVRMLTRIMDMLTADFNKVGAGP
jgi:hypothetical protein